MATRKKYIDTDGVIFYTLPEIWKNTSPITPETIINLGWTVVDEEYTPTAEKVRYSKLKIVRALKAVNAWETVKAVIENAGAWDEWLVSQELSSDDTQFMALFDALNLGTLDKDEILQSCIIVE